MQDITLVRRLQAAEKLIIRLANSVSDMQAYLADTGTKVRLSRSYTLTWLLGVVDCRTVLNLS